MHVSLLPCSSTAATPNLVLGLTATTSDSDWPQLRGLAILALRGALKFFAVLNVLGEDFMVFWTGHDELFNRFREEFKNSKSFPSGPFYFRFVLPDSLF